MTSSAPIRTDAGVPAARTFRTTRSDLQAPVVLRATTMRQDLGRTRTW